MTKPPNNKTRTKPTKSPQCSGSHSHCACVPLMCTVDCREQLSPSVAWMVVYALLPFPKTPKDSPPLPVSACKYVPCYLRAQNHYDVIIFMVPGPMYFSFHTSIVDFPSLLHHRWSALVVHQVSILPLFLYHHRLCYCFH